MEPKKMAVPTMEIPCPKGKGQIDQRIVTNQLGSPCMFSRIPFLSWIPGLTKTNSSPEKDKTFRIFRNGSFFSNHPILGALAQFQGGYSNQYICWILFFWRPKRGRFEITKSWCILQKMDYDKEILRSPCNQPNRMKYHKYHKVFCCFSHVCATGSRKVSPPKDVWLAYKRRSH